MYLFVDSNFIRHCKGTKNTGQGYAHTLIWYKPPKKSHAVGVKKGI